MSSMHGAATTLRRRLLGVGFIALVVGGIALSVAGQQNTFRSYITVAVETDKVGNQLAVKSDVKARGLIIGEVSRITPTEDGATLELALNPEHAALVPSSASARLLPKTLFGERFVSLQFDTPEGPKLSDGDVITQDRSSAARELAESFEKLLPVLQAVEPQKLNSTLTAMSTALSGRGEDLGSTLSELGEYLGELNPHLPDLADNLDELADFSDNLADVAPDLVEMLDNFRLPSRTLVEKQQGLTQLNTRLARASQDLESYISSNKRNFIRVGEVSRPTLELLAEYSPSVPCVVNQMARALPEIDKALGKGTGQPGLRAKLVLTPTQEKYSPGVDEPEFNFIGGEFGTYRGPWCFDPFHPDIPDPLPYPYRMLYVDDGSERQPDARSELDGQGLPCDALNVFGREVPAAWLAECRPGTRPDGSGMRNGRETGGGGSAVASSAAGTNAEESPLLARLLSTQIRPDAARSLGSLLLGPAATTEGGTR